VKWLIFDVKWQFELVKELPTSSTLNGFTL